MTLNFLKNIVSKIHLQWICLLSILPACSFAQRSNINMPEHDFKPYYFGITFGFNYSSFQITQTESFALHDTFKVVQPQYGPGFNLGLLGSLKLNRFFDVRFNPMLAFAEKPVRTINLADEIDDRSIESIYMQLPVQLKIKSDRIHNFRFYGLIGGKLDFDLAANARSRKLNEYIRVSAMDLGAEIGVGFEFYYPNFILAPEIKLSQGLMDSHYKDSQIPLSNTIENMRTRMFVFCIHLEG